ncbi:MAG: GTPase [Caldilineaceae bacterium]|nr:GTPase [Caldilineaceae bacterium]
MTQRVLIMGAAGRDFHNFNVYFRDNPDYEVIAFTAAQIPNIDDRRYPPELAGAGYPAGIPILPEADLTQLIRDEKIDLVIFGYSDVTYEHVMRKAAQVMAAGANYQLLGPDQTMLKSSKPVIAVTAVRTGVGKSQTSRRIVSLLAGMGLRAAAVRHPMPYGDLAAQAVQRFASREDLVRHQVTIEEREEYEPYIELGHVIYAGVDYARILHEAEGEADVIIWDGGNNDLPFYAPDLWITLVDPHRPDHTIRYYPGEINAIRADVIILNKVETADFEQIETARRIVAELNPDATVIDAASPLFVEDGEQIRGKRVLVIEDGPTLTHGEMTYGAGWVAARRYGAREIVDPRPYAAGSLAATFAKWPATGPVLPAMGYGDAQVRDLQATIAATPADVVLVATPIDLRRLIEIDKPALRVRYELQEIGRPTLADILDAFVAQVVRAGGR